MQIHIRKLENIRKLEIDENGQSGKKSFVISGNFGNYKIILIFF